MLKAERAKGMAYLRSCWGIKPSDLRSVRAMEGAGLVSVAACLKDNVKEEPISVWPLDYLALRLVIEAERKVGDYNPKDDADLHPRKLKAVLTAGDKPTKATVKGAKGET